MSGRLPFMDVLDISGAKILAHPLTGERLRPLMDPESGQPWRNKYGQVKWPIMGGAPSDDDDDDDDDDSGSSDKDDDAQDEDKDESEDDDTGGDDDEDDTSDSVSRAEYAKLEARMKAADKRASQAEAKIKKQEDAKKDDLTKATERVTELEATVKERDATIANLRLENAFVTSNKHSWHDIEATLILAKSKDYLDGVVDEESGEVDKKLLKKTLDKLAKDMPHLLKSGSKEDEEDEEDKRGPSGVSHSRRSKKDEATKAKQLKKRFSALR